MFVSPQVRSLTEALQAARSEVAGLEEEKEDLARYPAVLIGWC